MDYVQNEPMIRVLINDHYSDDDGRFESTLTEDKHRQEDELNSDQFYPWR